MTEQTCRADQPTVPLIAAAGGMAEPTRRTDQPIVPLTVGDWRHSRADATGRRANNTPDSGRLAACQPLRPPVNQGGPREHLEPVRLGPPMQDPLETRSKAPSIVPEKLVTPYLEVEHIPQEPDTLSSDSIDSLRVQLRRMNKWLDEVQKEVTKSNEEAGESSKRGLPFAREIQDKPIPTSFRLPTLESYDGSSDSTKHVAAFRAQMTLYDSSDALMCRVFPTTFRGPARMWYSRLGPTSISLSTNSQGSWSRTF
ncbi:hypothetical protein GW17_00025318 [Ensete ventricosum]|nr:hypothetical protein GW17_00025318 [Ensete ventricosum]